MEFSGDFRGANEENTAELSLSNPTPSCIIIVDTGDLFMKTTVQKWGNSYAVRIPRSFMKEIGLDYRTDVELTLEDGKLVIQPLKEETVKLDDLLAQVTKKNLHSAEDTGAPMGNEAW
jgi:antitoxin MazE